MSFSLLKTCCSGDSIVAATAFPPTTIVSTFFLARASPKSEFRAHLLLYFSFCLELAWMRWERQTDGFSCGRHALNNALKLLVSTTDRNPPHFSSPEELVQFCGHRAGFMPTLSHHRMMEPNKFLKESALEKAVYELSQGKLTFTKFQPDGIVEQGRAWRIAESPKMLTLVDGRFLDATYARQFVEQRYDFHKMDGKYTFVSEHFFGTSTKVRTTEACPVPKHLQCKVLKHIELSDGHRVRVSSIQDLEGRSLANATLFFVPGAMSTSM